MNKTFVISAGLLVAASAVFLVGVGQGRAEEGCPRPDAQQGGVQPAEVGPQLDERSAYRSPNHICLSPDGLRAYVVNQTANSVSVLDIEARTVTREIPVGDFPNHAAVSADGRRLYVTSGYGYTVEVVDLDAGVVVASYPVAYEPYGVTLSADGQRLYVANSLSNTLVALSADTGDVVFEVPVGRNPRYVVETPAADGSTHLLVTNGLSRGVSIVAADSGRVLETRLMGRASLLRQIVCSPDGRWAFVTQLISHDEQITVQIERGWINSNGFAVLDLAQPGHYVTLPLDSLVNGAANPWGMALSSDGQRLYVTLAGVHEVAIIDVPGVLALVAETRPEQVEALSENVEIVVDKRKLARRVPTGGIGPRGVALHEGRGELLVTNYFSDSVSVLDAASGEVKALIPLGAPVEMTLWREGEMLFNDARICQQRFYSCASCHQEDGTMDGLNWDLINDGQGNAKNAKSLHDAYDAPPSMWSGVRGDMNAGVAAGQRFLGFIPTPDNHKALMAYLGAPPRAPNPYRNQPAATLARGENVYRRARCHVCHPGPIFADLRKHDLGLGRENDFRSRFDTPSLRECYRTGPYLHDGRAATLRDIFTDHNPDDLHGLTSGLSNEELDDLVAYLRSL